MSSRICDHAVDAETLELLLLSSIDAKIGRLSRLEKEDPEKAKRLRHLVFDTAHFVTKLEAEIWEDLQDFLKGPSRSGSWVVISGLGNGKSDMVLALTTRLEQSARQNVALISTSRYAVWRSRAISSLYDFGELVKLSIERGLSKPLLGLIQQKPEYEKLVGFLENVKGQDNQEALRTDVLKGLIQDVLQLLPTLGIRPIILIDELMLFKQSDWLQLFGLLQDAVRYADVYQGFVLVCYTPELLDQKIEESADYYRQISTLQETSIHRRRLDSELSEEVVSSIIERYLHVASLCSGCEGCPYKGTYPITRRGLKGLVKILISRYPRAFRLRHLLIILNSLWQKVRNEKRDYASLLLEEDSGIFRDSADLGNIYVFKDPIYLIPEAVRSREGAELLSILTLEEQVTLGDVEKRLGWPTEKTQEILQSIRLHAIVDGNTIHATASADEPLTRSGVFGTRRETVTRETEVELYWDAKTSAQRVWSQIRRRTTPSFEDLERIVKSKLDLLHFRSMVSGGFGTFLENWLGGSRGRTQTQIFQRGSGEGTIEFHPELVADLVDGFDGPPLTLKAVAVLPGDSQKTITQQIPGMRAEGVILLNCIDTPIISGTASGQEAGHALSGSIPIFELLVNDVDDFVVCSVFQSLGEQLPSNMAMEIWKRMVQRSVWSSKIPATIQDPVLFLGVQLVNYFGSVCVEKLTYREAILLSYLCLLAANTKQMDFRVPQDLYACCMGAAFDDRDSQSVASVFRQCFVAQERILYSRLREVLDSLHTKGVVHFSNDVVSVKEPWQLLRSLSPGGKRTSAAAPRSIYELLNNALAGMGLLARKGILCSATSMMTNLNQFIGDVQTAANHLRFLRGIRDGFASHGIDSLSVLFEKSSYSLLFRKLPISRGLVSFDQFAKVEDYQATIDALRALVPDNLERELEKLMMPYAMCSIPLLSPSASSASPTGVPEAPFMLVKSILSLIEQVVGDWERFGAETVNGVFSYQSSIEGTVMSVENALTRIADRYSILRRAPRGVKAVSYVLPRVEFSRKELEGFLDQRDLSGLLERAVTVVSRLSEFEQLFRTGKEEHLAQALDSLQHALDHWLIERSLDKPLSLSLNQEIAAAESETVVSLDALFELAKTKLTAIQELIADMLDGEVLAGDVCRIVRRRLSDAYKRLLSSLKETVSQNEQRLLRLQGIERLVALEQDKLPKGYVSSTELSETLERPRSFTERYGTLERLVHQAEADAELRTFITAGRSFIILLQEELDQIRVAVGKSTEAILSQISANPDVHLLLNEIVSESRVSEIIEKMGLPRFVNAVKEIDASKKIGGLRLELGERNRAD